MELKNVVFRSEKQSFWVEFRRPVIFAALVIVIVCIVLFSGVFREGLHKGLNVEQQEPKISLPTQPQVVQVKGESTHTREVVYVPKETDPVTGRQEKTDVQIDRREGKVYVRVNGKEYQVPANVQEGAKFDNGKLILTEQTEMRLEVKTPRPAFNVGVGWSLHGPALQVNGPLYKNAGWWLYGDKKTVSGGLQFSIMK